MVKGIAAQQAGLVWSVPGDGYLDQSISDHLLTKRGLLQNGALVVTNIIRFPLEGEEHDD